MKKAILSMSLLLGLFSVSAQTDKVGDLMARAERQIYSARSSEASFTSIFYDEKGREQSRQSGKIYLQGERFRLEYGDILAVFDGKTLTYHDEGEETLTISQPTAEELLQINPLYFLRSRGQGFDVKMGAGRSGVQTLVYTPKAKSNISQVSIDYRQSDAMPQSILVVGKDKRRLSLSLKAFKTLTSDLPANRFVLSKEHYPHSEVVDLR